MKGVPSVDLICVELENFLSVSFDAMTFLGVTQTFHPRIDPSFQIIAYLVITNGQVDASCDEGIVNFESFLNFD